MKATCSSARLLSLLTLAFDGIAQAAPGSAAIKKSEIPSYANVDVHSTSNGTTWPWREYKSSPLQPPNMNITGNGSELAEGYIFLTPFPVSDAAAIKQQGGFVMTDQGDLVYGINDDSVTDLRVQTYQGKDYLTYWSGTLDSGQNIGRGWGHIDILDSDYNIKTIINPIVNVNSGPTNDTSKGFLDLHEHEMTDFGTVIVAAYNNTQADLSSVGGPKDGWIFDSLAMEVDMTTQEVLFLWRSTDHVPFTASHATFVSSGTQSTGTQANPWDWFHVNSIQRVGANYLINSQRTWTTYMVDPNGTILWTLEGSSGGSFGSLPSQGNFSWQHYVRAHNVTASSLDLSIYDDHNSGMTNTTPTVPSRGLVYHLDLPPSRNFTPVLTHLVYTPSDPLYSNSQGSYYPSLSNSNQFLGYGQLPYCREYGPAGDLRWQTQFGAHNSVASYRCQKASWQATPGTWDPALVVENGTAYVSWNGATDVQGWNVYTEQGFVGRAGKKGFETVFEVPSGARQVQVGAVQWGREVRRSGVVSLG